MAEWFEPPPATRAASVAQIVTDLESCLTTDASGKRVINIDAFMILAATRLAAIPDPTHPVQYSSPTQLRGADVRPFAEDLLASLLALEGTNTGSASAVDLGALIADCQVKSDAVTAAFNRLVSDEALNPSEVRAVFADIEANLPSIEDRNPQTVYYRTTFVTDREEESQPSVVSDAAEVGSKDSVNITVGTVPSSRNISYWRPYRSNSGNEAAEFQYVPNAVNELGVPIATTSLDDAVPNSELQEVCPSTIWLHPPTDLAGIVAMANGIHIGFIGNMLRPSPNGIPYAFPHEYGKSVEWPIVGLAAWEQSVFVGTRGKPAFVSGTDAASLAVRKLDSNQACVSARGICSTQAGVVYPSPDGLCLATPQGVRILTDRLFSREEWQALSPEDLMVAENDGVVYFMPRDPPVVPLLPEYLWQYSGGGSASLENSGQRWVLTGLGSGNTRSSYTNPITAKHYCEFQAPLWPGSWAPLAFGITNTAGTQSFYQAGAWCVFTGNGGCGLPPFGTYQNGVSISTSASFAFINTSRVGVAVDVPNGKIWFRVNGTWVVGDPAAGTSPALTFTPGASTWRFFVGVYSCLVTGSYNVDIYPSAASQLYAAPTGFTPFQPI